MNIGRAGRWITYGGSMGLLAGLLVILGFLTIAHLGHVESASSRSASEAFLAELSEPEGEPKAKGEAPAAGASSAAAAAKQTPFSFTTWGILERIAAIQLDLGDREGSFQTLSTIPPQEEAATPVYRTGRDKAFNLLLIRLLRRHGGTKPRRANHSGSSEEGWIEEAKAITGRISEGLPRAGAWLKFAEHFHSAGDKPSTLTYLKLAVDETKRPDALESPSVSFAETWRKVGGSLLLLWPVGLTTMGTLVAGMGRRLMEKFTDDFGTAAVGWVGLRSPERAGESSSTKGEG